MKDRARELAKRPTVRVALVLVAVFAGAVVLDVFTNVAHVWMPNIAIDALTVAVTITVIEEIVQREARRSALARAGYVTDTIRGHVETFCEVVAIEYSQAGLGDVPERVVDFLTAWLALDEKPRSSDDVWGMPMIVRLGAELDRELYKHRAGDREVLPHELVIAIDELSLRISTAGVLFGFAGNEGPAQRADSILQARAAVVDGVRVFAEALETYSSGGRLLFSEQLLNVTNERL